MLGDGDESQVAASHQYLTDGLEKIFPEYVDLADEFDSPPNCPISGIPHMRRGERAVAASEDGRETISLEGWA
jgi:hypothetical protein